MMSGEKKMDDLKEALVKFKLLTEELIEYLKKEQYDNIENLFNERQKIINNLSTIKYSKEEFISLTKELSIKELDNTLGKLMIEKKMELKEEVVKLKRERSANKQYNKGFYENSNILSKKI